MAVYSVGDKNGIKYVELRKDRSINYGLQYYIVYVDSETFFNGATDDLYHKIVQKFNNSIRSIRLTTVLLVLHTESRVYW